MSLRQRLQAAAFVAASAACSALPRRVSLPLARAAGRVAFRVLRGRRRIARENLAAALGAELSLREREAVARESFGHAAAIAMDLLTLPRVARDPDRYCEVAAGSLEVLRGALAEGKGVILVAGHFGLFESMGIRLGHDKIPLRFVAKPFANPWLDAAVNRLRSLTGNGFIHKGGAKAQARDALAAGECVAIVVDQHVSARDRLWIPFFGLEAATTRSLGALSLESGAPVVPIHSFPLPGGRCRCEYGPALRARATGSAESDAADLVRRTIAEMEAATRRSLSAWLWLHRRWKVRPDAALAGYPSYSRSAAEEAAVVQAREAARLAGGARAELNGRGGPGVE